MLFAFLVPKITKSYYKIKKVVRKILYYNSMEFLRKFRTRSSSNFLVRKKRVVVGRVKGFGKRVIFGGEK